MKLSKYEFLNIIRSRWVFFYTMFLFLLSVFFLFLVGNPEKALVTVSSVVTVLVPLTCVLFTSFYWYNSEKLMEILLTQPISRKSVLIARFFAMSISLGSGFFLGVIVPFLARGYFKIDLLSVCFFGFFLAMTFTAIGLLIGVAVNDKMRGVGLGFGVWFYFILAHDLLILAILIFSKDYPMDLPASVLASLNPIGLTRVILLVMQDASMLLGHSGALVREILVGPKGVLLAATIVISWLSIPFVICMKLFARRDV
ncbi:MAG: ABC transporter permease subunit [Pseudobdellovibrionaceae bacterium]